MSDTLALKYRPQKFSDMVGHPIISTVLEKMVEAKAIPNGLLFSGPSGVGKTTAARILAKELNPTASAESVIEIDAASHGGVADVRELTDRLLYSSGGDYRVVIIDECHSMTRDAFNALLITLEEPPEGTVFILVTTEPYQVPKNVRGRLLNYEFNAVTAEDIYLRLKWIQEQESIEADDNLLSMIASQAQGDVRRSVMLLDQTVIAGIRTAEDYRKSLGEVDFAPVLIASMMTGDYGLIFSNLDKVIYKVGNPSVVSSQILEAFRDMLILKTGGDIHRSGSALNNRKSIAARLDSQRIISGQKLLWDLKTRIKVSDDLRTDLELALVLLSDILTRNNPSVSKKPEVMESTSQPLTPEQMKSFTKL